MMPVEVFVRSGFDPESISLPGGSTVYELEPSLFKTIQSTETSQGVLALVRPREFEFSGILDTESPLIAVLCRLQDPGNTGTIVRIAESFGATACIATRGTAGIYNPKVVRASAGSIFRLPHAWNVDTLESLSKIRDRGIAVVGTAPGSPETIENWDWRRPVAVLIGNEGGGLNDQELGMCDKVLAIPHNSRVESLNSAVAAAVVLYEASRQRKAG
jgi:TrmH family RNA methyltransferase